MISKQIFSLNFMFLSSLIKELCTKEENDKTGCKLNFGHECSIEACIAASDNMICHPYSLE